MTPMRDARVVCTPLMLRAGPEGRIPLGGEAARVRADLDRSLAGILRQAGGR